METNLIDDVLKMMDVALCEYYVSLQRNDYYSDGIGKFSQFCIINGIEPNDIGDELRDDANNCVLVDFDPNFPFQQTVNINNNNEKITKILEILKYCYKYHKSPKIYNINDIKKEEKEDEETKEKTKEKWEEMTWDNIINGIEYQLYPKISKSLKNIFTKNKEFKQIKRNNLSDESIENISNELCEINNLSKEEIVFIKELIKNATYFDPINQCLREENINKVNYLSNGIIYWLGTDKNKKDWRNPSITGDIKILCSSLDAMSKPIESITARKYLNCCTSSKKKSWIMMDLLNVKILPTHYALKHARCKNRFLRNWYLEGSNNSTNGIDGDWIKLSIHTNDTSLNKSGAVHKWSLLHTNNENAIYSQFKVYQYDKNSSNTYNLALSAFEIYGVAKIYNIDDNIKNNKDKENNKNKILSFFHESNNDKNGLLYYLGTGCGTKQSYINPADSNLVLLSSSSLQWNSDKLSAFVGRNNGNCFTKDGFKSFMCLNLKRIQIKLTKYTLKNNENNENILRNWHLTASNDGKKWIIIKKHKNDKSLNESSQSFTWDIKTNEYFSRFRIINTGVNNDGNYILSCCGIELYGDAINCDNINTTNVFFRRLH